MTADRKITMYVEMLRKASDQMRELATSLTMSGRRELNRTERLMLRCATLPMFREMLFELETAYIAGREPNMGLIDEMNDLVLELSDERSEPREQVTAPKSQAIPASTKKQ